MPATPATKQPPAKKVSRLGKVKAGVMDTALRFCFYGDPAIGKSTLAAYAPKPIVIDCEDGSHKIDVARYVFRDEDGGHVPETYQEIVDAVNDLLENDHDYQTLVIDTLDRLESLLHVHLCERDSHPNPLNKSGRKLNGIESYGYGKGFNVALDEFRSLCRTLDALRLERKMNIILLGHSIIRTFKNPEGEDYDRYHLRINDKAAGFVKEWCDVVGFAVFEEHGAKPIGDDNGRAKGYSTGRRLLRFQRTAAYDAKSRISLPNEVELAHTNPWAPLAEAIAQSSDPDAIRRLIAVELERIGNEEFTVKVNKAVNDAGSDAATLSRYLNELRNR